MAEMTVKQLADVVGTPVDRLLEQLEEAGVGKSSGDDAVSDDEKVTLLEHLRRSHGRDDGGAASDTNRITLRRKRVSELKVGSSAGRRAVNVEVRGKRTYVKRSVAAEAEQQRMQEIESERERREREQREQEQKRLEAEEARRKEEEQRQREREEAEQRAREEEERQRLEAEEQAKREEEEKASATPEPAAPAEPPPPQTEGRRRSGKKRKEQRDDSRDPHGWNELHVAKDKSGRRRKSGKGQRATQREASSKHGFEKPTAPVQREVTVPETISVGDLANKMAVKTSQLIKTLMGMGVMATINQVLDQDTALLAVEEMGHKPVPQADSDVEQAMTEELTPEEQGEEKPRPPVITVMGHVDHGKTSLLDYIRRTKVTSGEAGGITQHIGAYHVETPRGMLTFLDTPGHAAFTAMRARGAQCTDIVVLVVAADDGVKPQTIEAIEHARAAGVAVVVAVNKMDKEEADPERVKSELAAKQVVPEDWGGDTIFAPVSALKGEGVDDLLESILLQAEVLELKATSEGFAKGVVIEATLEKGRGPVATVLVQSGTLHKGDTILCGSEFGRVRAMFDEAGRTVDTAGPSMPAVVLGLSGTPSAGDDMLAVEDERKARELASFRHQRSRDQRLAQRQAVTGDDIFSQVREDQTKVVNLVVKADVQGSFEALRDSLDKLSGDEVKVKVIGGGVGGINESDVNLALASNAMLVGFNVRADATARRMIDEHGVDVHYYSVIYDLIDNVKARISGMLAPEVREEIIGLAEVKDVFKSPKFGQVAGCLVVDGVVRRSAPIRVLRDNVVIYEGELESLRRFKDDANEVRMGTECGIGVRNYNDVKVGDQIEVFERTEIARTI
jgi:translation initiation factor IF-2